jgi:hypothetical protein
MFHIPIAVLAAIFGGASKPAAEESIKGAEALIAYLHKEGPMAHRVLASWKEGNGYCAAIEFLNTTLHGGYVERVKIKKPVGSLDIKVARPQRAQTAESSATFPDEKLVPSDTSTAKRPLNWLKPDDLLPLYVAPASTGAILVQLHDDSAGTLAKTPVVTLSYESSIIGGSDAQTAPEKKPKEVDVRLRHKGPFYLDA